MVGVQSLAVGEEVRLVEVLDSKRVDGFVDEPREENEISVSHRASVGRI